VSFSGGGRVENLLFDQQKLAAKQQLVKIQIALFLLADCPFDVIRL